MKIEVWEEKQKEEEQPLRLRLKQSKNDRGGVTLHAVDKEGENVNCGCLLNISAKGQLSLRSCVSEKLGLKLDYAGRLEVTK